MPDTIEARTAWAVCPNCRNLRPPEAPLCACGHIREWHGDTPVNAEGVDRMRRMLLWLSEGIGWWDSGDGANYAADAVYLRLHVQLLQSNGLRATVDDMVLARSAMEAEFNCPVASALELTAFAALEWFDAHYARRFTK